MKQQVAIEIQSARNAAIETLKSRGEQITIEKLNSETIEVYNMTRRLVKKIEQNGNR
jgi:hypothetical protein